MGINSITKVETFSEKLLYAFLYYDNFKIFIFDFIN